MTSLLVSHPHAAAVASALASALEVEGQLALYATGLAAVPGTRRWNWLARVVAKRPELANRLVVGVAPAHLRSLGALEAALRAGAAAARLVGGRASTYDALFVGHDRAVAAMGWPQGVTAAYAYEDGALKTFERARREDVARVYDLPSPHHATVEQMWREEARRWQEAVDRVPVEPAWKKKRKDSELGLASAVCVASGFTRRSIEGIVVAPVAVVPYGFPTSQFTPGEEPRPNGPFTVLAVGAQSVRKGTHYLLEAWRQVGLRDARLRLVGSMRLPAAFLFRYAGLFEHVPYLPRSRLAAEYRAADLVAFPTLCDGFGLVIQEAMCCGTPVVTTPCGGGPECITEGVEGWIVPERNVEALAAVLAAAAADRDRTRRMGRAARARAESWVWAAAASALVGALSTQAGVSGR
jgi:glycosyltransferase involved in cell wall biosynthesis